MKQNVFLIAQNVNIYLGDGKHQFARTGDIGFYHLKKAGATGIILGHSEFKDDPKIVNEKWQAALKYGLSDNVVLIGEDWDDLKKGWGKSSTNEINKMKNKLKNKFLCVLHNINKETAKKTVFGYEPGWGTRGSGKNNVAPPQAPQINSMCLFLRTLIKTKYGNDTEKKLRIIYGGSSSPERSKEIMCSDNVNGLILGSAGTTTDWVKKIGLEIQHATQNKKNGVLVLNWKAYELKEFYSKFLKVINNFNGNIMEVYLSPVATELVEVKKTFNSLLALNK
ncbi:MAG: triose-phosphate isomerase [Patescibacteria group bacterium]|nr:triose-phosphate isomerase [Patescibacteria group bacterium]